MESPVQARGPSIKSASELDAMRKAGQVVARMIAAVKQAVEPGVTTKQLDAVAAKELKRQGAKPAFLGYMGFPATICVSINEEIVHGIPGDRVIQDGDLVSVDVGAIVGGFHGDAAVTVGVGKVSPGNAALIDTTRRALEIGISAATDGARVGDVSWAIQSFVESQGYSVVREYVGHGVGRALHEEPPNPHIVQPGKGPLLRAGMVIALEPMVNIGSWETRVLSDDWTVVTGDNSLSAHFENTLAITKGEAEVLTKL